MGKTKVSRFTHSSARLAAKSSSNSSTLTCLKRHKYLHKTTSCPLYLRRFVVCIIPPSHGPLPLRLGCCSLRKPLGVLKQVNFCANFKIFHEIVKKILVVFGFGVLGLKSASVWEKEGQEHTALASTRASEQNRTSTRKTPTHALRSKSLHFSVEAFELKHAAASGLFVHWRRGKDEG